MPHDRFYVDALLEEEVTLNGEEFHHLSRVMRKAVGDVVELVNGKGTLATATLTHLSKDKGILSVNHAETKPPLLPPLTLIQALPKTSHLEWIFQKGTELGVSRFVVYPSAQSEKKDLSENQKRRLHHILIGAMKQCGRLDLPTFEWGLPSLEGTVFFGDLTPGAPLLSEVASLPATLMIGPEKGWTHEELERLRAKGQGVRIAPYTLRAETAAIAALSILVGTPVKP
ncbi:MAG: 16S rRNA (uracil(1498)-N(3))-methyltransferase [Chlamydiia bacterium]|nr:16S rRNA (uracil(1498)-N(3))-methyltransferase [Chlamydiia bacterium]